MTAGTWTSPAASRAAPPPAEIRAFRPGEGGRIVDRNDQLLGRIALVRRVNVPIAAIPPHVRRRSSPPKTAASTSTTASTGAASSAPPLRNLRHGGVREGFSTITMQVARNSFLDALARRTLRRKLIELRLTRLIESELTKDQILELYLNVIYLGNGMYGVEAASRDLFGKSVDQLTVARGRCSPRCPRARAPTRRATTTSAASRRRNLVLGLMAREHYLSDQLAAARRRDAARASPRTSGAPTRGRAVRARRGARLHRLDPSATR